MQATGYVGDDQSEANQPGRAIWTVLIVASGLCLSPYFACVTPFAALATLAGLKLSRRDAFAVMAAVWLANQVVGYGYLGYPWTWDSMAWGVVIGLSSGLGILAARGLSVTRPAPLAVSLPLVGAFTAFELGLYVAGFALPGSDWAFSATVIAHVFLVNAVALCGLMAVYHLVALVVHLAGHHGSEPTAAGGASFR
ncbi:MAG TPA: hypothetical protein VGC09_13575 [Rhodopila sp.]